MTTVHVFVNWTSLYMYVKQDEENFQHGDVALIKQKKYFLFSHINNVS